MVPESKLRSAPLRTNSCPLLSDMFPPMFRVIGCPPDDSEATPPLCVKLPVIVQVRTTDADVNETLPLLSVTFALVGELLNRTLYVEFSAKTGVSLAPGTTPPI